MLKNNFKNSVECNGKYFEKFETIKKEEFIDFKTYEMTIFLKLRIKFKIFVILYCIVFFS